MAETSPAPPEFHVGPTIIGCQRLIPLDEKQQFQIFVDPNESEGQIREIETEAGREERGEERHCGLGWRRRSV